MMRTYYVLAEIDGNPTLFRVNTDSADSAVRLVDEYCIKRYTGTSIVCYAIESFTEEQFKERLPHAIIILQYDELKDSELFQLSSPKELKKLVREQEREYCHQYPGCRAYGKLIYLSDVERKIARFYQINMGFDAEKAVMRARIVANMPIDLSNSSWI